MKPQSEQYTPYQHQIRAVFATAYNFFDTHKHPRTPEDWQAIAAAGSEGNDPLTARLMAAVTAELEREYLEYKKSEDKQ